MICITNQNNGEGEMDRETSYTFPSRPAHRRVEGGIKRQTAGLKYITTPHGTPWSIAVDLLDVISRSIGRNLKVSQRDMSEVELDFHTN